MQAVSSDYARSAYLGEPISEELLDNTFEGALLSEIFSDATHDIVKSSEEGMQYLGAREINGEGVVTFYSAGDIIAFIALANASGSRSAKVLLPALERGLAEIEANSRISVIHLSNLGTAPSDVSSLTIAEILQDLLIHHADRCDGEFFTLNGSYHPDSVDPDHLGGIAAFITADEIQTMATDGWLSNKMHAHRVNRIAGPKI